MRVTSEDQPMLTVEEWRAKLPSADQCARDEYDRLRDLTIAERLSVFDSLHRDAVTLLGGREPLRDPADDDWWRRWQDPNHGR